MSNYTTLQNRCQRGEPNLASANNLLAGCHSALGRLIAERDALQALLTAADERLDGAVNLLEVWRTWLGPTRESCDETGKKVWDRIDAVTAPKPEEGGGDGQ